MTSPEKIEDFLSVFTRKYLREFNMLERNISYSLAYMEVDGFAKGAIDDIQALTFCKKVKLLKSIISNKQLDKEFSTWLSSLEKSRILRNYLVHGHWEVACWLDKPIRFDAMEVVDNHSKTIRGDFTIDELDSNFKKLENIGKDFSELRNKYERLKITQSGSRGNLSPSPHTT